MFNYVSLQGPNLSPPPLHQQLDLDGVPPPEYELPESELVVRFHQSTPSYEEAQTLAAALEEGLDPWLAVVIYRVSFSPRPRFYFTLQTGSGSGDQVYESEEENAQKVGYELYVVTKALLNTGGAPTGQETQLQKAISSISNYSHGGKPGKVRP